MLYGGLSSCIVINGAGIGMALRGSAALDSDVRVRLRAAAGVRRLSDHFLAVEWVYCCISITVEHDGWHNPFADGQSPGPADPDAASRSLSTHHGERGWQVVRNRITKSGMHTDSRI